MQPDKTFFRRLVLWQGRTAGFHILCFVSEPRPLQYIKPRNADTRLEVDFLIEDLLGGREVAEVQLKADA